jgi:putative transposase
MTPADVHEGRTKRILEDRHKTRTESFLAAPERYPAGPPKAPQMPDAVYINPPEQKEVKYSLN